MRKTHRRYTPRATRPHRPAAAALCQSHLPSSAPSPTPRGERAGRLLTTPEQAVRALRPGRRSFIGSAAAEPSRLVQAMVDAAWQLSDNELLQLMTVGPAPYTAAACEGRFRANTFFIGPGRGRGP